MSRSGIWDAPCGFTVGFGSWAYITPHVANESPRTAHVPIFETVRSEFPIIVIILLKGRQPPFCFVGTYGGKREALSHEVEAFSLKGAVPFSTPDKITGMRDIP
jgi:hypothetical protein